jgi:hypothetical protein
LKACLWIALACLAGCSWFHKTRPAPEPSQLIVTGVVAGSEILIDGKPAGPPMEGNTRTRTLEVSPGTHVVEIKSSDTVVYREDTYVGPGDHRVVTVLSGNSRD